MNLPEQYCSILWKTGCISNEIRYLAEDISKQSPPDHLYKMWEDRD